MKPSKLLLLFILFSYHSYSQCWTQIAAGGTHNLAIKSDGTLWAWGKNEFGQLGDGTTIDKNAPIQVGSDTNWAFVDAESYNSTALKTDGSLWGWGKNNVGQNGNGNYGNNVMDLIPTRIGIDNDWIKFASPNYAIKSNGTLWGWSYNANGGIGTGDDTPHYSPVQIGVSNDWIDISNGGNSTLALKSDHTVWGWRLNYMGALAIGETSNDHNNIINVPTQTGNGTADWNFVMTDGCCWSKMIKIDGSLWAMGSNTFGNAGIGSDNGNVVNTPTRVGLDNDWLTVTNNYHTLAIKNNQTLWGWGLNQQGQLGDGTFINKNIPTQVGIGISWLSVKVGLNYTIALSSDNTLYAWGWNIYGQLGDGTFINKNVPTQIGNSCLLKTSGFNPIKKLQVFPNPTTNKTILNYYSSENTNSILNVSNILGQNIYNQNLKTKVGENTELIDLSQFKQGVYFVSVIINGKEETVKIIKQ